MTREARLSWCYLLLPRLCLIVNRFSSLGYIGEFSLFSEIFIFCNFFFLFFLSCFESEFGVRSLQPGESCRVRPSEGAAEANLLAVFVFVFFVFFTSPVPPLCRPLGRSPPSSRRTFSAAFLEAGTGLLGFHALVPAGPSCLPPYW